MKALKKTLIYDASVLIEIALGSLLGKKAVELALNSDVYTTDFAISELYYILCRKLGEAEADVQVKKLIESNVILPIYVEPQEGGKIKCKRAISLADAFIIALANKINGFAVFAKKEREIVREIKKKPINNLLFLEDL